MFNGSVVMKGIIHRGNDKNTYNIETHLGLVCVPNRGALIKRKNVKSPISYSSMPMPRGKVPRSIYADHWAKKTKIYATLYPLLYHLII